MSVETERLCKAFGHSASIVPPMIILGDAWFRKLVPGQSKSVNELLCLHGGVDSHPIFHFIEDEEDKLFLLVRPCRNIVMQKMTVLEEVSVIIAHMECKCLVVHFGPNYVIKYMCAMPGINVIIGPDQVKNLRLLIAAEKGGHGLIIDK